LKLKENTALKRYAFSGGKIYLFEKGKEAARKLFLRRNAIRFLFFPVDADNDLISSVQELIGRIVA
jgi:hypothetical protein